MLHRTSQLRARNLRLCWWPWRGTRERPPGQGTPETRASLWLFHEVLGRLIVSWIHFVIFPAGSQKLPWVVQDPSFKKKKTQKPSWPFQLAELNTVLKFCLFLTHPKPAAWGNTVAGSVRGDPRAWKAHLGLREKAIRGERKPGSFWNLNRLVKSASILSISLFAWTRAPREQQGRNNADSESLVARHSVRTRKTNRILCREGRLDMARPVISACRRNDQKLSGQRKSEWKGRLHLKKKILTFLWLFPGFLGRLQLEMPQWGSVLIQFLFPLHSLISMQWFPCNDSFKL